VRVRALHVPVGTRVEAITQHLHDSWQKGKTLKFGSSPVTVWRVWLGIKNKQVSPDKYEGTYLELQPDGSIVQCTTDREEYEVMEKI